MVSNSRGPKPLPTARFHMSGVALAIGLAISGSPLLFAGEEPASGLEEVTVTGTRVQQAVGMTTPTPVAALTTEELQAMAPTSVTEAMTQLPQFYNSQTAENFGSLANGFFASPGGGSLNLRGLGTKRTLTLLDGRRMVPATAYGGPDINMFPDQLLERIEVVTGGASAQYGTDAVSGVVNYILDKNYEGFKVLAQMGTTQRSDAENYRAQVAFGHGIGDKAHVLFSAATSYQSDIVGYQGRDWYQGCGYMQNPNVPANNNPAGGVWVAGNGGYSQSTPQRVPICDMHSTTATYDGYFQTGAGATLRRYELQPDGHVIPFNRTLPATGAAANSGVQSGGGGQNFAETDTVVMPGAGRYNFFLYGDYDITDNFTVYAQAMYGHQTLSTWGRVGDFLTVPQQSFTVFRDNAFLPPDMARIMDAAGLSAPGASVTNFTRIGTREDWGDGQFQNENWQSVATIGFNSNIESDGYFNGWAVDGYAQYGVNKLDARQQQGMRLDRVYAAMDAVVDPATGSIKCRVTVISGYMPDCVPLNIFGRGNANAAAIDWIKGFDDGIYKTVNPFIGIGPNGLPMYGDPYSYQGDQDKHRRLTVDQLVAELTASGRLFEGWAGDVNGAVGVNYRKETIEQNVQAPQGNSAADITYFPVWCPDTVVTTDSRCRAQVARGIRPPGSIGLRGVPINPYQNIVETQFSNVPFITGEYDVKEAFAETVFPLIADRAWMQDLNLQAAVRWADYAGSGDIWSWKGGIDAAFTPSIRLRGTYSHDTRAANIAERFDRTGGFTLPVNDRVVPLPTGWTNPTAVTTQNGGNPEVLPETANTITAGIVFTPQFLPGFDMSIDWLRVELEDAIETLAAQQVIDQCYLNGDQDQCAKIFRDPASNIILFIPQIYQNLSLATTEAIDAEFGYTHSINLLGGNERFTARLIGSYLIENSTTNSAGVKTDLTGSVAFNLNQLKATLLTTYINGPFSWNISGRYIGGGELNTLWNTVRPQTGAIYWDVADNDVGSVIYWDTRIGYNLDIGGGRVELFANVQNLTDKDPPIIRGDNVSTQVSGGYDRLGRRFVVGFNLEF